MEQGKQMVLRLVEMVTGGLILCFCLLFLWGEHGDSLLKSGGQRLLEAAGTAPGVTGHLERLKELNSYPAPVLSAEGIRVVAGEPVSLWEQVLVQEEASGWASVSGQSGIVGRVQAFYDGDGQRISPLRLKENEVPEEISSVVGYDPQAGQLIFFSGGCYRVAVHVVNQYGRKTEAVVTFLAEIR